MKHLFLAAIFIFSMASSGFSQLSGGVKGGLNISSIIITNSAGLLDDNSYSARYSYEFGSFVTNMFTDHFAWKLEMLFSNKGYLVKVDDKEDEISLNYLNWPLMLVYYPGEKLGIEAGLEPGFLISGESLYNSFDLGLDIGATFAINTKWSIGLRYNQGFPFHLNIDNLPVGEEAPRYQHSVIQFSIGYNLVREMGE